MKFSTSRDKRNDRSSCFKRARAVAFEAEREHVADGLADNEPGW